MSLPPIAFASPVQTPKLASLSRPSSAASRSASRTSDRQGGRSSPSVDPRLGQPADQAQLGSKAPLKDKGDIELDILPTLDGSARASRESDELGSARPPSLSSTLDGPAPVQQVDDNGRRPIILGGKEERLFLASLFFTMFAAGWNDSSMGPLLLRVQGHYDTTFTIVSLTFVFNFLGFLIAACANVWLTDHLGFGKTITLGACLQVGTYVLQCWAPPFPVFCLSFVISGIALGLQNAQSNALVARLPNMMIKLSILHAVYGLGATTCPLVSTQFSKMEKWYYHYFCSLGVAVINVTFLVFVVRLRTETSLLGRHPDEVEATSGEGEVTNNSGSKMREIIKNRTVGLFALFTLFYVGLEVTLGGWMPTYLILVRGGTSNSGYISTGFFGGIMLGRLVFIDLNRRLGERHAVVVYTVGALALEFIVWFVPSLIGSAVAISLIGLLLGPMYPLIMSVVTKILPRKLQSGAIGFIACFGQGGSALFPFLSGLLAERYGVKVMPPVVVSMLVGLGGLWLLTPKVSRRDE